jgi:hypothetical protein
MAERRLISEERSDDIRLWRRPVAVFGDAGRSTEGRPVFWATL